MIWAAWAVYQGYDYDWDILNYHFYNGFALIHQRVFANVQPAMLQTYFAPVMDAVFYVMVRLLRPTFVVIIIAAFQSLSFPLLFRLAQRLLGPRFGSGMALACMALLLTLLGATAPESLWEAGSPRGDATTAVLILAALLCVIDAVIRHDGAVPPRRAALAGALAGLAAGLKLTNAAFALGLLGAVLVPLLFARGRVSATALPACLGAMAAAFLLSYGWWGWLLYRHLGNPVFPNFNQVFRSPYAAAISYADPVFALHTWRERLLFPFVRNSIFEPLDPAGLFDPRMAFAVPLCALALIVAPFRRATANPAAIAGLALIAFVLVSYFAWLMVFPVNRYFIAVDLVAPLACAVAAVAVWPGRYAASAITVALAVALPAAAHHTRSLYWLPYDHRHGSQGGYFGVAFSAPPRLDRGVVAMLGDRPTTFVIPFFPHRTVFVRLQGSLFYPMPGFDQLNARSTPAQRRAAFGNAMGGAICRRLDDTEGGVFLLRLLPRDTPHDEAALAYYGLRYAPGPCTPIGNKSRYQIELCPALRSADPECRTAETAFSSWPVGN